MRYILNAILVTYLCFIASGKTEVFRYESVGLTKGDKIIVKHTRVIDTEYLAATCEEQKSLFGVTECVKPYPVIRSSDLILELSTCEDLNERMICGIADGLYFSAPLDDKPERYEWSLKGINFEIVANNYEMNIMGTVRKNIIVIYAKNSNGGESLYFYSRKYGLLGFKYLISVLSKGLRFYINETYHLTSEKGFGYNK